MFKNVSIKLGMSLFLSLFFVFVGVPFHMFDDLVTRDPDFPKDIFSAFLLNFITISFIDKVCSWLDQKYPWSRSLLMKRAGVQLMMGVLIPALFIWGYIYMYRLLILKMDPLGMDQFSSSDYPVAILIIIFINVYFIGLYFYRISKEKSSSIEVLEKELFTLKQIEPKSTDHIKNQETHPGYSDSESKSGETMISRKTKLKILIAIVGNKNIPIPVEEIAYLYKSGNYIQLKTFKEQTYLLNHTLEELMQLFDEKLFFRVNRQVIVSLKSCHYFTNEENGKLELHLSPVYEEEIIISQKRAQQFKEWLNK